MTAHICCFSGGKDSTAMLIHIIENNLPLDEVLYVDVGDWMWESSKDHIKQVEEKLGVKITILNIVPELKKGFERWGFPSFFNRWCTGEKKEAMRKYIRRNYGERESIIQYIGYCADEEKRTSKKLYSSYDAKYPLVDAGVTTSKALKICEDYGFNFNGVYEHHSHYNCWLCPLQRINELKWIFDNDKDKWNLLREMQFQTDGTFYSDLTIFDLDKRFWEKNREKLKEQRMYARKKYNRRNNNEEPKE